MLLKKCREYSIPLILGVAIALIWANLSPDTYHHFVHTPIIGNINFHFLINDVFMVLFFASAGIEIVTSLSPGGALNPIRKAVAPLMATAGGVIGPVVLFFVLNALFGAPEFTNGWGICTATDIALAWLLAKIVFGKNHPAVSFLLLLAVADDAIGLIIIAVFYPDPTQPTEINWLLFVVLGMYLALLFNRHNVTSYLPYIFIAGLISWIGMLKAHIHPALALVIIVPFLPKVIKEHQEIKYDWSKESLRNYVKHHWPNGVGQYQMRPCPKKSAYRKNALLQTTGEGQQTHENSKHSTLHQFEERISPIVDYGLIFFGISNAGVELSAVSSLTWIIFLSLIIGKTVGIALFSGLASLLKFKLPEGMGARDVIVAGLIGGMGLTVALFVAGSAFVEPEIQAMAKMGALFTIFTFALAFIAGKVLRIKKRP